MGVLKPRNVSRVEILKTESKTEIFHTKVQLESYPSTCSL
jgi:hypothetical protein